jgi:ferredoxin
VGAIDPEDARSLDQGKCILCCACIKVCPENARAMKPSMIKDIAVRLTENCKERREPEFFFRPALPMAG